MWNASENRNASTHTCPTLIVAHHRPSRGLRVASCAWHLSLAGPAVAGRLCGSSGQSLLAPSMLSQLLLSALLIVLRADTTAPRAQYWAQQDAAAAAAKQGLQWLARIARQYVRHMDVDCATMRHSRGHVQCEEAARAWPVDLAGRPAHTSVQAPGEVRWA